MKSLRCINSSVALVLLFSLSLEANLFLFTTQASNTETSKSLEIKRDALSTAIIANDRKKMRYLIATQPELINAKDFRQYTPLHWSSSRGFLQVTQWLIEAGADVNAKDIDGFTPLRLAIINDRESIVLLLLQANAEVNTQYKTGKSDLDIAWQIGNLNTVNALIEHGAEKGEAQKNILNFVKATLKQAAKKINGGTATERYANLRGVTPLHIAARRGDTKFLRSVLPKESLYSDFGYYNLSSTTYDNDYNNNFDPSLPTLNLNIRDHYGWTPLHYAYFHNQIEFAELLIQAGASTRAKNINGNTPMDFKNIRNYKSPLESRMPY